MSIEGLLISLALLTIGAIWIVLPFFEPGQRKVSKESLARQDHDRLSRHYAQVVSTLRDVDEDFSTGKIQPEEYRRERQNYAQYGVELLKTIYQLEQQYPFLVKVARSTAIDDQAIDAAIEAAVAEYLNEPLTES